MNGTDGLAGWNDFFAAEVGASAALAGLLFVAVSLNLRRILEFRHLPDRAVEALLALLSVLVFASLGLVPGLPPALLGAGWAVEGAALLVAQGRLIARQREMLRRHPGAGLRLGMALGAPLCLLVAGGGLAAGKAAAVLAVVPATFLAFGCGLFDAWVLLVEIQR